MSNTSLSIPRICLPPTGVALERELEVLQLTVVNGRRVQNDEIGDSFRALILHLPDPRQAEQRDLEPKERLDRPLFSVRKQLDGGPEVEENGTFSEVDHE